MEKIENILSVIEKNNNKQTDRQATKPVLTTVLFDFQILEERMGAMSEEDKSKCDVILKDTLVSFS